MPKDGNKQNLNANYYLGNICILKSCSSCIYKSLLQYYKFRKEKHFIGKCTVDMYRQLYKKERKREKYKSF